MQRAKVLGVCWGTVPKWYPGVTLWSIKAYLVINHTNLARVVSGVQQAVVFSDAVKRTCTRVERPHSEAFLQMPAHVMCYVLAF